MLEGLWLLAAAYCAMSAVVLAHIGGKAFAVFLAVITFGCFFREVARHP